MYDIYITSAGNIYTTYYQLHFLHWQIIIIFFFIRLVTVGQLCATSPLIYCGRVHYIALLQRWSQTSSLCLDVQSWAYHFTSHSPIIAYCLYEDIWKIGCNYSAWQGTVCVFFVTHKHSEWDSLVCFPDRSLSTLCFFKMTLAIRAKKLYHRWKILLFILFTFLNAT